MPKPLPMFGINQFSVGKIAFVHYHMRYVCDLFVNMFHGNLLILLIEMDAAMCGWICRVCCNI